MSYRTHSWLTISVMFLVCMFSGPFLAICAAVGVYFGTRIGYQTRGHAPYFQRNRTHYYGTCILGLGIMLLGIAVGFPPIYGVGLMIFESMVFMNIAYDKFGE